MNSGYAENIIISGGNNMRHTTTLSLLSALALGLTACFNNDKQIEIEKENQATAKAAIELRVKMANNISLKEFLTLAEKLPVDDQLRKDFDKLIKDYPNRYEALCMITKHAESPVIFDLCAFTQFRAKNVVHHTTGGRNATEWDNTYFDTSTMFRPALKEALLSIDDTKSFMDILDLYVGWGYISPDVAALYQATHTAIKLDKKLNEKSTEKAEQPQKTSFNYRTDWRKSLATEKSNTRHCERA